jgi:hypothetical protein
MYFGIWQIADGPRPPLAYAGKVSCVPGAGEGKVGLTVSEGFAG